MVLILRGVGKKKRRKKKELFRSGGFTKSWRIEEQGDCCYILVQNHERPLKESGLILNCPVKSTLRPAKAESRPPEEQQQLLRSPKPECITGEVFVFGSAPDRDSCVAPSAEDIHQLTGYSKQTLSDSRLTSRQNWDLPGEFCRCLDYMGLYLLYIYTQLTDLCFKGGICSAWCLLMSCLINKSEW